jgi:hypothetical protein
MSFAVPAAAGLMLGWAALAQADAPPVAPIFYCPTPGKAAPPAAPAKAVAHAGPAHVVHTSTHRHTGCPVLRVAAEHHHWRGREPAPRVVASNNDVSASQAFIYRYERALQGLDARAADEAWAEGRRGDWRHGGPPMHGPVMAQRELPLPPAPEGWRRPPERHVYAETQVEAPLPPPLPAPPPVHAPPPRYVERQPPPPPAPEPAPHPSVRVYALQDGHSGYRYQESEQQSERAGGWSYSEQDGHGQYRQWGDRFAGEPDRDGRADGRYVEGRRDDGHGDSWYGNGDGQRRWAQAQPRYRCPPPVPTNSCSAGPNAPVRHADVAVAGRDAAGYLTWPGKTE